MLNFAPYMFYDQKVIHHKKIMIRYCQEGTISMQKGVKFPKKHNNKKTQKITHFNCNSI